MRSVRRFRVLALLLVGGLIAAGAALWIADAVRSPNVAEVVRAAIGPMPDPPAKATGRTVDGVGFPDWTRWGWTATGGRTDEFTDHTHAATVVYAHGGDHIAYTLLGGSENIDNLVTSREVDRSMGRDKVALELIGGALAFSLTSEDASARSDLCAPDCTDGQLLAQHLVVKRKRGAATVVLTAWPPSNRLFSQLQLQAVRPRH